MLLQFSLGRAFFEIASMNLFILGKSAGLEIYDSAVVSTEVVAAFKDFFFLSAVIPKAIPLFGRSKTRRNHAPPGRITRL